MNEPWHSLVVPTSKGSFVVSMTRNGRSIPEYGPLPPEVAAEWEFVQVPMLVRKNAVERKEATVEPGHRILFREFL